jgi:hypothetical protein
MQALLIASAVWSLLCPVLDPDGHEFGKFRIAADSARECEARRQEIVDYCVDSVPRDIINGRRDYMLICTSHKPGGHMLNGTQCGCYGHEPSEPEHLPDFE